MKCFHISRLFFEKNIDFNVLLPFWIGWTYENIESKFFSVNLQKKFWNKLVIENKLSLSDRRGKSMHYPESPKVTSSHYFFGIGVSEAGCYGSFSQAKMLGMTSLYMQLEKLDREYWGRGCCYPGIYEGGELYCSVELYTRFEKQKH